MNDNMATDQGDRIEVQPATPRKPTKPRLATVFKTGRVVMLKSGGPKMTVEQFIPETLNVRCIWMNHNGDVNTRSFSADYLESAH